MKKKVAGFFKENDFLIALLQIAALKITDDSFSQTITFWQNLSLKFIESKRLALADGNNACPDFPDFKRSIVDVKCFDQLGRTFIVEMQMQWVKEFASRLLYGASQAYVYQLERGKPYQTLCPVYGLGLINDIFDKSDEWYHHYKMSNVKNGNKIIDGIELILLELPKFKPNTRAENKLGALWLRFLNEAEQLEEIPSDFKEYPELIEAMELSQESGFSRSQLEYYNSYWDAVSTERTLMTNSYSKGREEGREEGVRLIAKNLKQSGQNAEFINQITGLSVSEVEKL